MKILFTTDRRDGPSTMWYEGQLEGLRSVPGVEIDFYNRNYRAYDVILFMGYDPRVSEARKANPRAKIGVIDARPAARTEIEGADFVVANGIEMQDWYAKITAETIIYPPYPVLPYWGRKSDSGDPLILGYHGNKVHLQAMFPRITKAVEALADNRKVELWALYNLEELGEWQNGCT